MSVGEEDISAFLALGVPIDGEVFALTPGSAFGPTCLTIERPVHHVPVALADAESGYKVRNDVARVWPDSELDYSIGDPQVAVAPLIGDL